MDLTKLVEEVMELSTKQPDGVRFRDADTILADLIEECDFQVTGIADELLRLYLEAENKDDFKSLFFFMTEKNFEDYLLESKKVMEENIAKAEPRAIQVYLSDSGNDEKESIIFETDAPKDAIKNWIKTQHNSISSNYPFHHMVMGLLNEGYMVKLLYDRYSSKCSDVKLIDQYSCEEVYHVGYSIGNLLHHVTAFTSLYRNASCVPHIDLTDSMEISNLRKIAHELGIRFIKGNQFCLSKKKAHLCDLDTTDIERIARQERYVVIDGIMEDTKEECYVLTKKDLL